MDHAKAPFGGRWGCPPAKTPRGRRSFPGGRPLAAERALARRRGRSSRRPGAKPGGALEVWPGRGGPWAGARGPRGRAGQRRSASRSAARRARPTERGATCVVHARHGLFDLGQQLVALPPRLLGLQQQPVGRSHSASVAAGMWRTFARIALWRTASAACICASPHRTPSRGSRPRPRPHPPAATPTAARRTGSAARTRTPPAQCKRRRKPTKTSTNWRPTSPPCSRIAGSSEGSADGSSCTASS